MEKVYGNTGKPWLITARLVIIQMYSSIEKVALEPALELITIIVCNSHLIAILALCSWHVFMIVAMSRLSRDHNLRASQLASERQSQ